jgi:hypothetical protein
MRSHGGAREPTLYLEPKEDGALLVCARRNGVLTA